MPADKALTTIAEKLRDQQLILFVGSGMSAPYFPTWAGLLSELQVQAFQQDPVGAAEVAQMIGDKQYLSAAWAIQHKTGAAWRHHIKNRFKSDHTANSTLKQAIERRYAVLKGLPFASLVTTNYDNFLLKPLEPSVITHVDEKEIAGLPDPNTLLKLHGDAIRDSTLILTSTDFTIMKLDRNAVNEFMHNAARNFSFLFLGYSFEDEDVLWWLERACHRTQGKIKGHFGLVDGRKWGAYKRELYHQRYGIQMVDAPLDSAAEYPDIEVWLHQLQAAYKHEHDAPIAKLFLSRPLEWPESEEYVDPQVLARKDKSLHSLDTFLIDWLRCDNGTRQFLVLLGEFGTGKTQFSYRAHQLILEHSQRAPSSSSSASSTPEPIPPPSPQPRRPPTSRASWTQTATANSSSSSTLSTKWVKPIPPNRSMRVSIGSPKASSMARPASSSPAARSSSALKTKSNTSPQTRSSPPPPRRSKSNSSMNRVFKQRSNEGTGLKSSIRFVATPASSISPAAPSFST